MHKPFIVCISHEPREPREPRELDALLGVLKTKFEETYRLVGFRSAEEALSGLEDSSSEGTGIALILYNQILPDSSGTNLLRTAHRRYPKAMKLLMTDEEGDEVGLPPVSDPGLNGYIRKPWEARSLLHTVENLLIRFELAARISEHQSALERKNQNLEALHRVGAVLAASFDIESILHQIARAAEHLIGEASIDVFYAGSREINSRARWLPHVPGAANLKHEARKQIEDMLARTNTGEGDLDSYLARLEQGLSRIADGRARHLIPIAQQDELLGFMIVKPITTIDKEHRELLSILTLQAATALRNIHLTQERIHFERLSAFGQMIGSLVHDFRSPLTAVRGYAGMLGGPNLAGKDREEYARLAIEECDRLNSMINELLEFTRGGRSQLRLRSVALGDYFEDLRPAIQAHFESSTVRFEMDLGYVGPVLLDPDRMSRAVLNMVSNASQAMNGNGRFVIRSERRGHRVTLEFQDTGCGIPEEIRHRIFEPFFSYGKAQGIGLGMSIAKKIVEEHGGAVDINSDEGLGTQIRFHLPLEAGSSNENQTDEPL